MTEKLCLQSKGLSFSFSDGSPVLNNIDLTVPKGSIYGFLGPNGAGKTTTLKLILGLLKVQKGQIEIFEKNLATHRVDILQKVGSLIESPSLYGHLSAKENLKVWQPIFGFSKERIDVILALVGLDKTGTKKAKNFSLGMKQRLSIAIAMAHRPDLLILDEPTNGLDPNGILEMRQLLKHLNRETGVTILISSHLLAEIEKLVSHIGIIHKGDLIFQGTLAELQTKQKQGSKGFFRTSDAEKGEQILAQCGMNPSRIDGKIMVQDNSDSQMAKGIRALVENGLEVYEVATTKDDLEQIFMDLTTENNEVPN